MATTGFWSYVRADDDSEGGRIRALADDLAAQYEALTTEQVNIFVDKSSLGWGDDWDAAIEQAVVSTSFFVPVVSPRYLNSEACRRELRLFVQKSSRLGLEELIMPLVWFDVPQLVEANPTDDLVGVIKRYHWVDWRTLRFEERTSKDYRTAVASLAQRLVDVSAKLSMGVAPVLPSSIEDESNEAGDEPGVLDLLAAAEEAIPNWTQDLTAIGLEISEFGKLTEAATAEMQASDQKTNPLAARLTVIRKYARELDPHAQKIEELGNDFTTHLYDVDGGIRALFAQARRENLSVGKSESMAAFVKMIRDMAQASRSGLGSLQGLVQAIQPVESMSRDLRPSLVKLRRGLAVMVEGQHVVDGWERLADEIDGDDDGPDAQ